jgi:hypothetical protein
LVMYASSTVYSLRRSPARSGRARVLAGNDWSLTLTVSSAGSTAIRSRASGSGTPSSAGITPLLASRADTGEVLHVRLRKGQAGSSRGVVRFAEELIARVTRAGASDEKLFRADSAFWNKKLIARLQDAGWAYSISVRLQSWGSRGDRTDPRVGLAALGGLSRGRGGANRRDDCWRTTTDRPRHPADRGPSRALA